MNEKRYEKLQKNVNVKKEKITDKMFKKETLAYILSGVLAVFGFYFTSKGKYTKGVICLSSAVSLWIYPTILGESIFIIQTLLVVAFSIVYHTLNALNLIPENFKK